MIFCVEEEVMMMLCVQVALQYTAETHCVTLLVNSLKIKVGTGPVGAKLEGFTELTQNRKYWHFSSWD